MKHFIRPIVTTLILCGLVVLVGCGGAATIQATAVDGAFRRVADRHDRYVNADDTLSPLEKRIDLRDTALLRGVLDAAKPATQPTK